MSTSDQAMQLLVAGNMAFKMPSGQKFTFRPLDLEDFLEMLPPSHFKTVGDIKDGISDLNELFLHHYPESLESSRVKKYLLLLKGLEHLFYCLKEEEANEQKLN